MANVIVTGEITGLQETPVFYIEATQNNSVFNFDNLTITNNQESILILPIQTTNSASIIINDCTFNSTTDDSYAIWFDTNKYAITITGNNSHSTKFMFNYVEDLNIDISEVLENSTSTPLYASIDYTFGGKTLTNKFVWTNSDRFKFVASANYYSIKPQIIGNVYTVFSFFNFSFNPNGGTYAGDYTIPTFNYSNTTATEFPTNNNVTKRYSFLQSWLGKFVIDHSLANSLGLETNTWYYDANAIAEFKTQNYDLTKIANYFKTSVDVFVNPTGFSSYAYDENNPFLPIEMCAKFETTPIFIAKWELINYTITFDSMGGSLVDEISKPYGETIVQPVTPTKEGYTFVGWFEEATLRNEYIFSTMPASDFTLYAKWQINTYTLTFVTNCGTPNIVETQAFGTEINFPTLEKVGYSLTAWCTDNLLEDIYLQTTTPASNITLYAKWEKNTYSIYLITNPFSNPNINITIPAITAKYGDTISEPTAPTVEGFEFDGWYTSTKYNTKFNFTTMPVGGGFAYAKWLIKVCTITYYTNTLPSSFTRTHNYGEQVLIPSEPTKQGYSFGGWYTDSSLTTPYEFGFAPANDFSLYAKWIEKEQVVIDITPQHFKINGLSAFEINSSLNYFFVSYYVNGSWTTQMPTEIGSYDVKIYRAEDENYAEFTTIIEDGYVINQKDISISWLIYLFFAVFVIEIIVIVFIKRMQKTKKYHTSLYSIILPFGIVSTNQFVLAIVGASLVLFGFIYIIVELVKLHKIVPDENNEPSVYDTRSQLEKKADTSTDTKIDNKVDSLLKSSGLAHTVFEEEQNKDEE